MAALSETKLPLCALDFAAPADDASPEQSEPRAGELCPQCGLGKLAYDGALNLVCPVCHFTAAGGGGCT